MQLADSAGFHQFLGADIELVRAVLSSDLNHSARPLGGRHDPGALRECVGDGFLEVDVLVRLKRGHRHRIVQVLGTADENDVHVRVVE